MPGATMWIMAMFGLLLSALLLFAWHGRALRQQTRDA